MRLSKERVSGEEGFLAVVLQSNISRLPFGAES